MRDKAILGRVVTLASDPAAPVDAWVIETLDCKPGGYYLDIGAGDGVRPSNTYTLEKQFGWRGILVEPRPSLTQQLERNRKGNMFVTAHPIRGDITPDVILGKFNSPTEIDYLSITAQAGQPLHLGSTFSPHCVKYRFNCISIPFDFDMQQLTRLRRLLEPLSYELDLLCGWYACFKHSEII